MAVAGHEGRSHDCELRVFEFACRLLQSAHQLRAASPAARSLTLRVGMNSGPVVGGIVGTRPPRFTFLGGAVNVASRMESNSSPSAICLSASTWERLLTQRSAAAAAAAAAAAGGGAPAGAGYGLWALDDLEVETKRMVAVKGARARAARAGVRTGPRLASRLRARSPAALGCAGKGLMETVLVSPKLGGVLRPQPSMYSLEEAPAGLEQAV